MNWNIYLFHFLVLNTSLLSTIFEIVKVQLLRKSFINLEKLLFWPNKLLEKSTKIAKMKTIINWKEKWLYFYSHSLYVTNVHDQRMNMYIHKFNWIWNWWIIFYKAFRSLWNKHWKKRNRFQMKKKMYFQSKIQNNVQCSMVNTSLKFMCKL